MTSRLRGAGLGPKEALFLSHFRNSFHPILKDCVLNLILKGRDEGGGCG